MNQTKSLLILIAVAAAGAGAWFFWHNDPDDNALQLRGVATRGLAAHLAKHYPGQHALVISNPFTARPGTTKDIVATELAGQRGVREGLGTAVALDGIVFPELRTEAQAKPRSVFIDSETTTPLSFLVADDAFDKLAEANPTATILVSLVGLPAELDLVKCWTREGDPRFALLLPDLRIIGTAESVRAAMKRGKLAAFVLAKPDAPGSAAQPEKDWEQEFQKQFLLVTPENIDQLIHAYPKLFAQGALPNR